MEILTPSGAFPGPGGGRLGMYSGGMRTFSQPTSSEESGQSALRSQRFDSSMQVPSAQVNSEE